MSDNINWSMRIDKSGHPEFSGHISTDDDLIGYGIFVDSNGEKPRFYPY